MMGPHLVFLLINERRTPKVVALPRDAQTPTIMTYSALQWVGAVCFFEWGLIHIAAMFVMCPPALKNDIAAYYVPGLLEYASPEDQEAYKKTRWPKWTGRPLFQHGWNLGWSGVWSFLCVQWILTPNEMLPILALVPWLSDWGYFMAIDIPELGGVVPQAQTFIITIACICGCIAAADAFGTSSDTLMMQIAGYSTLAIAAIINKITWKCGCRKATSAETALW